MSIAALVEHLGPNRCVGCARRGSLVCPLCRAAIPIGAARRIDGVNRVVAAWDYDGIARSLVLDLKLRGTRAAATELGRALVDRVWQEGTGAHAIVWIPARPRDIRRRGFDHAELIARMVARSLGLPCVGSLRRTGDRRDQTTLGAIERRANLRGAFAASRPPDRVAVVDDLMTTGATLADAARALRAAGTGYVEGLVACSVA